MYPTVGEVPLASLCCSFFPTGIENYQYARTNWSNESEVMRGLQDARDGFILSLADVLFNLSRHACRHVPAVYPPPLSHRKA